MITKNPNKGKTKHKKEVMEGKIHLQSCCFTFLNILTLLAIQNIKADFPVSSSLHQKNQSIGLAKYHNLHAKVHTLILIGSLILVLRWIRWRAIFDPLNFSQNCGLLVQRFLLRTCGKPRPGFDNVDDLLSFLVRLPARMQIVISWSRNWGSLAYKFSIPIFTTSFFFSLNGDFLSDI